VVRIHSPRPFILPVFKSMSPIYATWLKRSESALCPVLCHSVPLAHVASLQGRSAPAGECTGWSSKNRCGRQDIRGCTGPCAPPSGSGTCAGTCTAGSSRRWRSCTLSHAVSLASISQYAHFLLARGKPNQRSLSACAPPSNAQPDRSAESSSGRFRFFQREYSRRHRGRIPSVGERILLA